MNMNRTKTDKRDTQNRYACVKTVLQFDVSTKMSWKIEICPENFEASISPETPIQEVHEIVRSYYGVK